MYVAQVGKKSHLREWLLKLCVMPEFYDCFEGDISECLFKIVF